MTDQHRDLVSQVIAQISRAIIGKEEVKKLLIVALLSKGHLLIEGVPGAAKTALARVFAQAISGDFKRVQLTPDMLPTDITGFYIYQQDGSSRFIPGPMFANVVLADELNRTTPRTQSAFLEAMEEGQITIEGKAHPVVPPFMVIATQIPFGAEGTYPLTEVQVDRFILRAWSDYPKHEEEVEVVGKADYLEQPKIEAVLTIDQVLDLQEEVKKVFVSTPVTDYIVSLVSHVRGDSDVASGPSTRASLALFRSARALAFIEGRDFVTPDDVKELAFSALEQRIGLQAEAEMEDVQHRTVIQRALEGVPIPRGKHGPE